MTTTRKKPWMKFYPADWQADVELRFCSLSARGLWLELLCIMQKAEPEGYLLVGGKPPSTKKLALLCGAPERQIKKHLHELENAGVFSRDEGGRWQYLQPPYSQRHRKGKKG